MFSKTYLRAPATQRESRRLRNRLGITAADIPAAAYDEAVRLIRVETGAEMPHGYAGYDLKAFFADTEEFRDVLDAVTCVARAIQLTRDNAAQWISFCKRAFDEEGMAYSVDDRGEVHYRVDVAFHEIAESVVAILSVAPFAAAGASLDSAVKLLTQADPQRKHAIRDAFEAVETIFKLVAQTSHDLSAGNLKQDLSPVLDRHYQATDPIAQGAAQQSLEQLKDWTNACHKYRHGHGREEPVEPPLEVAVLLVSNALAFARWMASFAGLP
jgi:hypothetical protein